MKWFTLLSLLSIYLSQCVIYSKETPQNRCSVVQLLNGKVRARARGRIVRFHCNHGYTLVGNRYSTCIHGQWDTPVPVCVNAECAALPKPEHALVAKKHDGAILMYFCEAGYALIGASEIYCNGHSWNATAPYCRDTSATAPTKCDFEKPDLCWWEQDPLHDFDWRRYNFETPSSHIGTGPTHDHTLGAGNEGYYLYIEASGRLVNDTARIISPLYNASLTESGCFSFWYHMYGAAIGALRVYFKLETDTNPQLMFHKEGNQGNQWLHGIFTLPRVDKNFQLIIEGVRGMSYVSDIAVDDIAILQGKECDTNTSDISTTTMTTNNNDQVEIVSAAQTCQGRCNNSPTSMFITLEPQDEEPHVYMVEQCQCTSDCAEYALCCPDYAEYCVLAFTDDGITQEITEATTSTTTNQNKINITRLLPNITKPIKYETTTLSTTINRNHIPIDPKDYIEPNATKLRETEAPTTKISVKLTTKSTTTVHGTEPFILLKTSTTHVTTTYKPTTTTKQVEITEQYDPEISVRIENPKKFHHNSGKIGRPGIIGLIIGILTGIVVVSIVAFFIITRRKTYKRGTGNSSLSEDSDVRFLTSDEMLDFNLAKPSDNDEL
ncbi:PREDICTED: uncharacterized protein LOC106790023 isoform X1 [Polistes canadensis]|uniref:uncharacterized protein LOC106790023 isoform X1 n=1 Tax=Polistes canadensis TaxID=91411 RepID=UPI000718FC16|nr:PREDICTED: uncharacterized protein LOC106790023 isoform X1 [Polistes canadensis]